MVPQCNRMSNMGFGPKDSPKNVNGYIGANLANKRNKNRERVCSVR